MKRLIFAVHQLKKITGLDRSVKMFFIVTIFFGLFYSIRTLFFNFYILSLGFDKEFLGAANSMVPAATLVLGFPLGMLTDRIGRMKASAIGLLIQAVGYTLMLFTTSGSLLLVILFLTGTGEALFFISRAPLLTRLTNQENRSSVFSFNFTLYALACMLGNSLAGWMPVWFETLFRFTPDTTASYQGVLFVAALLALIALLPTVLIGSGSKAKSSPALQSSNINSNLIKNLKNIMQNSVVWKLFSAMLFRSLGVSLIFPYFNLFFTETFAISNQTLGSLFSFASLITGLSSLANPWLVSKLGGRIRVNVIAQSIGLVFLIVVGFSPWSAVSMVSFLPFNALVQMVFPLFNSFAMEQVDEDKQGTLSSILTLGWQAGWALMPMASGIIQERVGFTPIFLLAIVFLGTSNLLIWKFFKDSERSPQIQTVPQTS